MNREQTIEQLKELGIENPVNAEGRITLDRANLRGANLDRAWAIETLSAAPAWGFGEKLGAVVERSMSRE